MNWVEAIEAIKASKLTTAIAMIVSGLLWIGPKHLPEIVPAVQKDWQWVPAAAFLVSGLFCLAWATTWVFEGLRSQWRLSHSQRVWRQWTPSDVEAAILVAMAQSVGNSVRLDELREYGGLNCDTDRLNFSSAKGNLTKNGLIYALPRIIAGGEIAYVLTERGLDYISKHREALGLTEIA